MACSFISKGSWTDLRGRTTPGVPTSWQLEAGEAYLEVLLASSSESSAGRPFRRGSITVSAHPTFFTLMTTIDRSFLSTTAKARATLRLGISVFSCVCASDCKCTASLEHSPATLNVIDSQPASMRLSELMLEWLSFNLLPTSAGTKLMGSRFGGSSATWQPSR